MHDTNATRLIADLIPDPENLRGPVSPGDVVDLVESIREVGVLQPLVVTPSGNVVCGHRRLLAARLAGLTSVPVVVKSLTRLERLTVQLAENILRDDLSLSAEARGYQRMLDECGGAVSSVARRLAVPASRISERLLVLRLDEETRERFDRGELPAGAIRPLLAIEDLQERRQAAEDLAERRVTVKRLSSRPGGGEPRTRGRQVFCTPRPHERPAAPAVDARPTAGPCTRCSEQRAKTIAAIAALKRAEDVIRRELGNGYVPPRPPVLWTDAERRFA